MQGRMTEGATRHFLSGFGAAAALLARWMTALIKFLLGRTSVSKDSGINPVQGMMKRPSAGMLFHFSYAV